MIHTLHTHYRLYCGIDISKAHCHVAVIPTDQLQVRPFQVSNEVSGFRTIRQQLEIQDVSPQDILVVVESTGTYWMPVARALNQAGYHVVVINPLTARRHIMSVLERNKTDRTDALWLAQIALLKPEHLKRWHEPPAIYEELRQRIELRDALVKVRAKQLTRQKAIEGRVLIKKVDQQRRDVIIEIDKRAKMLEKQMRAILMADPEWGQTARYLLSIPGLGIYSVAALMMYTQNFTVIDNADQLASFVGVAPVKYESGATSYSYIGYSSAPELRQALYMCTFSAVRFNPIISKFYNRLVERGKSRQKVRIACIRKLLKLAWGCAKNQKMFDEDYPDSGLQAAGD